MEQHRTGRTRLTAAADREELVLVVRFRAQGRGALAAHDLTPHVRTFVGLLPQVLAAPVDRWSLRRRAPVDPTDPTDP